jgi:hypothetical protein
LTTLRLGRFLELSVPADDIPASLAFYGQLGFHELPVNDARRRPYAVVSDGKLAIGLHGAGIDRTCLTFVQSNLAASVRDLAAQGAEPEYARLGEETFNEACLVVHDDVRALLVEARTFSESGQPDVPPPPMGSCDEIDLGCSHLGSATVSWARFGIAVTDASDTRVQLTGENLNLALNAAGYSAQPRLRYETRQFEILLDVLKARDVAYRPTGAGALITAPEGTEIQIVRRAARDGAST